VELKWVHSVPKELSYPDSNEDCFAISDNNLSCAISDGASESFDSKAWAKSLCSNFICKETTLLDLSKPEQLCVLFNKARNDFNSDYVNRELTWSQKLAFDRGNFATLVGVIEESNYIRILAIGDSVAVWFTPQVAFKSHLLRSSAEFNLRPLLASSIAADDAHFFAENPSRWSVIEIKKDCIKDGVLYLMTDAIAYHLFTLIENKEHKKVIDILQLNSEDFTRWVIENRSLRSLKIDDTTLAVIHFNEPSIN
jgi:hypothetical protein